MTYLERPGVIKRGKVPVVDYSGLVGLEELERKLFERRTRRISLYSFVKTIPNLHKSIYWVLVEPIVSEVVDIEVCCPGSFIRASGTYNRVQARYKSTEEGEVSDDEIGNPDDYEMEEGGI